MFYLFSGLTIVSGFVLFMRFVYLISMGASWNETFSKIAYLTILTIILAVITFLVYYLKKKK